MENTMLRKKRKTDVKITRLQEFGENVQKIFNEG